MSMVSRLLSPPSRLLALDRWVIVQREIVIVAILLALCAAVVTFLMSARYMRMRPDDTPSYWLLLPATVAGTVAAFWFNYRFEQAFPAAPQDVTSVAISVSLWTALPQMFVGVSAAWIYTRYKHRRQKALVVRATEAVWIEDVTVEGILVETEILIPTDARDPTTEDIRAER